MKKHSHAPAAVAEPQAPVVAAPAPIPVEPAVVVVASATRDWSNLYTPIAIVIAGIFVAGGLMIGLSHGSGNAAPAGNQAAAAPSVNIKDVKTDGEPYIGSANAPVVMAFWSDFQCPYCKAFEVGGIPQITTPAAFPDIVKNYVSTGKLKVVW